MKPCLNFFVSNGKETILQKKKKIYRFFEVCTKLEYFYCFFARHTLAKFGIKNHKNSESFQANFVTLNLSFGVENRELFFRVLCSFHNFANNFVCFCSQNWHYNSCVGD